jgi:hypothetical protein
MMKDLVLKNRSHRRFYQDCRIESGVIRELIGLARLVARRAISSR